jgi:hypothetical protein
MGMGMSGSGIGGGFKTVVVGGGVGNNGGGKSASNPDFVVVGAVQVKSS